MSVKKFNWKILYVCKLHFRKYLKLTHLQISRIINECWQLAAYRLVSKKDLVDWFLWESCCTTHYRQVAVFQLCRCSKHNPRRRSWTWSWDKKFVHCQFEEGSRAGRAPEPTAVPSVQRWVRLCSWHHDGTSNTPSHTSMHVHVSNQQTTRHRCGRNNMELNTWSKR